MKHVVKGGVLGAVQGFVMSGFNPAGAIAGGIKGAAGSAISKVAKNPKLKGILGAVASGGLNAKGLVQAGKNILIDKAKGAACSVISKVVKDPKLTGILGRVASGGLNAKGHFQAGKNILKEKAQMTAKSLLTKNGIGNKIGNLIKKLPIDEINNLKRNLNIGKEMVGILGNILKPKEEQNYDQQIQPDDYNFDQGK